MTQQELEQILQLIDKIRSLVYDRYQNIYMPHYNATADTPMNPLPMPIPCGGKDLDRDIQNTNEIYVSNLYKAKMGILPRHQGVHDHAPFMTKVIEGINYMATLVYIMTHGKQARYPCLPLTASAQHVITFLQAILKELLKL